MVSTKFYGGLCNNFFQMAVCIAYGIKHKMDWCFPSKIEWPHSPDQKLYTTAYMNICEEELNLPVYLEPGFAYTKIPYMPDICLQGYWQSEKYFSEYRAEILKAFDIPYEFKEGWVSCHVRRGDYLIYKKCHPVVTAVYLFGAIIYMKEKGYNKFIFFSDDIDWCKRFTSSFNLNIKIEYSEGKTELEDLSLASSCEHFIGSNSAFSWWIYYLNRNENKIGVFPKKENWFGEALPHNVDDLYMPGWILL